MTSITRHNIHIDGAACFWTSLIIDHLPVFRSLVDAAEHYESSGARWYAGIASGLAVDALDW